jgi:hypothetical protein
MYAEDVGGRSLDVFNAGAIGQIWVPLGWAQTIVIMLLKAYSRSISRRILTSQSVFYLLDLRKIDLYF